MLCLACHPVAGDAAPASSLGAAEKANLGDAVSVRSGSSAGVTPSPKGFSFASCRTHMNIKHIAIADLQSLLKTYRQGLPDDLPSSEKIQKHQLVEIAGGGSRCKKCNLMCPSKLCPSLDILLSRPCMESGEQKIQLLFSKNWPDELKTLLKNLCVEEWRVVAHSGKRFTCLGNGELSDVPDPHEFPLLLEPIPTNELAAELEQLRLEEELLQEQLTLLELEADFNAAATAELEAEIAKLAPGCYLVASSMSHSSSEDLSLFLILVASCPSQALMRPCPMTRL